MKWLGTVRLFFARLVCACLATAACPGAALAADATPAVDPNLQILVLLHMAPAHFRPEGSYSGAYADPAGRSARHRIAARIAREHGLTMLTDWPMPLLGVDCYVMGVPPGQSAPAVVETLAHDPRVSWSQPMNVYRALGHDDPLFAMQPAAREWDLAELHGVATGRGVRVAIVDSGVETAHPDLAGQIVLDENFVAGPPDAAERHGTAVAGIVAARADNGVGIVGIAPHARLLALRACTQGADGATLCTSLGLARALQAAVAHEAQIINMSLSGPPDRLLASLLDIALARGITVVAAVDRSSADGGFPAAHRGVVAVVDAVPRQAAAGASDARDPGPAAVTDTVSGHMPAGAVRAPGRDIPTTLPGSRWAVVSGASYAAAHVSGLYALLRELQPRRAAAARLNAAGELVLRADGRIDACATVQRGGGACACGCIAARLPRPVTRE
jgi:hypothetical protein